MPFLSCPTRHSIRHLTCYSTKLAPLVAGLGILLYSTLAAAASSTWFDSAREAARMGDRARLGFAIDQLQGRPEALYAEYWLLKLKLADTAALPPDTEVAAFIQQHDGAYLAEKLRGEWLVQLLKRGDFARLQTEAQPLIDHEPVSDDTAPPCALLFAQHLGGAQVTDAARELLLRKEPSEVCFTLYDRLLETRNISRSDVFNLLRDMLERNQLSTARRLAPSLYSVAELKRFNSAIDKPTQWLAQQRPPLNQRIDQELMVVALARLIREDAAGDNDAFEQRWARQLPTADAQWVTGQLALAQAKNLDPDALRLYKRVPLTALSDDALTWRVRIALRAPVPAWNDILTYIDQLPPKLREQSSWIYWRGRALAASGRTADAEQAYKRIADQFDFYGQLAAEESGRRRLPPSAASALTADERQQARNNPGLQRSLVLFDAGVRTEAVREWNYALRGMNDRQLLAAADLARRNNIPDRAINTADRTQREHDFTLRYPMPYRDLMTLHTQQNGIDEAWVYGLIRQESRFMMEARSGVGASGLMQLMPATARWVARRIGMTHYSPGAINDTNTNILLGTAYLKTVLDQLDDSPVLASAAYNAGPGRPNKWRATLRRPIEGAIFAETIPFTETRDYVKKVLANASWYGALLTGQPQSLKGRLGMIGANSASSGPLPPESPVIPCHPDC